MWNMFQQGKRVYMTLCGSCRPVHIGRIKHKKSYYNPKTLISMRKKGVKMVFVPVKIKKANNGEQKSKTTT